MISGNTPEHIWVKVGQEIIWENRYVKLLGLVIDKELKFNKHVSILCKNASTKVTALARMVRFLPFYMKRVLM